MKKFLTSWMPLVTTLFFISALAYGTESGKPITAEGKSGEQIRATSAKAANPAAGERIKWQVIAAGGNRGTSTNFVLTGTAGQTAVGKGTSTNFQVNQGFSQNFAAGPSYVCGDANGDATVDISDAVYLIAYIFSGGAAPNPLLAGDANCDSTVDISDAVYLIAYIFGGGTAPCAGCK